MLIARNFVKQKSRILKNSFSTLNKITNEDINYFRSILSPTEIITDTFELQKYNVDWTRRYSGNSKIVLRPDSASKIQSILKYCNQKTIGVLPQGGNTSLVGGGIPADDEVILSMASMNKIIEFNSHTSVLTCESGCILDNLNTYLAPLGYEVPLDLGARGICQIGGNIATNAGGIRVIKFGPFKAAILGLEVVLPNGDLLDLSSKIRKDNTGLDLKQLFIGSEGILGVITKVNLLTSPVDKFRQIVIFQVGSYKDVLTISRICKTKLGRSLSALEYFDDYAYNAVIKNVHGVPQPFTPSPEFKNYYALVEICGQEPLDSLVEKFYEEVAKSDAILDSVMSENETQFASLWKLRENVAEGCGKMGSVFKYDVSLNIEQFEEITNLVRQRLGPGNYTTGYGHIGDGNIHINAICQNPNDKKKYEDLLEPYIFEYLSKCGGSISAEHGIGLMKPKYLHYSKNRLAIKLMQDFKNLFDPKRILSPKKMLPEV